MKLLKVDRGHTTVADYTQDVLYSECHYFIEHSIPTTAGSTVPRINCIQKNVIILLSTVDTSVKLGVIRINCI